ncbi:MAG TPA: ERF family protein [Bryobacteraceae bacterium]|nr:ERF family protein [Bryobacteraceae bacterium]
MEETALARTQTGELAPVQAGDAFLAVIAAAARDPQVDVGKMQQLLEMRERMIAKEAEREFVAALSRLQPKLPRITKQGTISVPGKDGRQGHKTPFAKYEDITKEVRPLLAEEGFSVSYSFDGSTCRCTLSHRDGHSKVASTPPLPMDKTGSKNDVQAVGSMMSYAKRYALCNVLDIVTVDQDDDAHLAGTITNEQALQIRDMISECGLNKERVTKLLAIAGVTTVEHIQKHQYDAIMESLRTTLRQKQGGAR